MKISSIHKEQIVFLLVLTALNLWQASTLPLIDDEAYYWVWSKHLAWGYYDHPPMIALFIKIGYWFFSSMLGVRLLSAAIGVLFFLIWIKILQPKTLAENRLLLALFGSTLIFQGLGFIATPDAPLLLFGSYFLWKWKNFVEKQNFLNSVLLGISISLAMYSKYHAAVLIFFVALPFVKFLKNKWFWLSLALALLLFVPHLLWQYNHDWASVRYHLFERNRKETSGIPFARWLIGLLIIANPLLLCFYGKSLAKLRSNELWTKSLLWVGWGALIFFGIVAITKRVQPQWNLIIYLSVVPITYLFYKNRKNVWVFNLSAGYVAVIFIARLMLLQPYFIAKTPMYKLKEFVNDAYEVNQGIAVFERYQKAALYNFYTQDTAVSIQVYTHRESQYDLWDENQSLLQGKEITFFGLEPTSSYFILDESGKSEYYTTISNFHSYPKIQCTVSPVVFNSADDSSQTMEIVWKNPYDKNLTPAKDSNLEAGVLFADSKTLEPKSFIPFFESVEIPANGTAESTLSVKIPALETGTYRSYIVLKSCGISGKIISNEMITHVE
ncbi:MAG: glycosyltransferase family 39 protein [Flavobacteriaceae bacterium]|jgi:hypothetical protein|nr:glycosyltransferase family 39 protein [Flavobacteriaceae bacterium]